MTCSNCGEEVREDVVFCSNCGARIPFHVAHEHHKVKEKPKKEKKIRVKKEKRPIGCLGFIVEFILIILLLTLSVVGVSKGIRWYKNYKYDKFIGEIVSFGKNQDIKLSESEKKDDWNNDGISNEEARNLNLNIAVKDSDRDGLSDYDEINIFHSNPLKYSSSDDLYGDGYKVAIGYDINIRYETYKTLDISPNVKVEANDISYMGAYYKTYKGAIPDGYYLGMEPFRIFSFVGEVDLLITNPQDFEVICYDTITRRSQKIKSRVEDDYLVFEIKNDNPILITYKEEVLKSMSDNVINGIRKYPNEILKEYYVLEYPLYSTFGGPFYIMEVNNLKAGVETDKELVEKLDKKYGDFATFKHSYINTTTSFILDKAVGTVVGESSNMSEKALINYMVVYGRAQGIDELEKLIDSVNAKKEKNKNSGFSKAHKNSEALIKQRENYWNDFSSKNHNILFNWHWNNIRGNKEFISSSTFNSLVANLSNGKSVKTYLYKTDKHHIVDAYEIVYDRYDSDLLYIKVRDGNFSNDMFWDYKEDYIKHDVVITLKRIYVKTWNGVEVRYLYDYNPLNRDMYHFSSFNDQLDAIAFVDGYGYAL